MITIIPENKSAKICEKDSLQLITIIPENKSAKICEKDLRKSAGKHPRK